MKVPSHYWGQARVDTAGFYEGICNAAGLDRNIGHVAPAFKRIDPWPVACEAGGEEDNLFLDPGMLPRQPKQEPCKQRA